MIVVEHVKFLVETAANDVPSGQVIVEELLVANRVFFFVRDGFGKDVLDIFVGEDEVQFAPPNVEFGAQAGDLETTCRLEFRIY